MQANELIHMGVLNVTPNSFSDNLSTHNLKNWVARLLEFDLIDIGAESTAPMNSPISGEEEWLRLEAYLNKLPLKDLKQISVDTYRPKTFLRFYQKVKKINPTIKIFWNDVSGKLDDAFLQVVNECKSDFTYIFCHNQAPQRELTGTHQDYVQEVSIESLIQYFALGTEKLKTLNLEYFLDPAPGFSKDRLGNQRLLQILPQLMQAYKGNWVWAFSRKSFLRFPPELDPKSHEVQRKLDQLQLLLVQHLLQRVSGNKIIIRAHDPALKYALEHFSELGLT